jgi:inorganic pyrophosphatase
MRMKKAIERLPTFNKKGNLNVVIETSKECRNKYKFDEEIGLFRLTKVLPFGMAFPYDFGFAPRTRGEDGDPIDVVVLMDSPVFSGCVISTRLVGIMEAEQDEEGKKIRNDRVIAVEDDCREFANLKNAKDLDKKLVNELEEFFVQYHRLDDTKYTLLGLKGPEKAKSSIERAMKAALEIP